MMFDKIVRNAFKGRRSFSEVKRKYPVNPEDAKKVPVFDHPISKPTYTRIFVCGNIQTGALGVPYMKKGAGIAKIPELRTPRRLGFAEKFQVTSVAAGFGFTLFGVNSDANEKLYGTGINTDSQIGSHEMRQGHPMEIIFFPRPIPLPLMNLETKILKISAGRAHSVVLTDEGLFLLGSNAYGQCGRHIIPDENYLQSNFIHRIECVDDKKVVDIECGQDHSLVITDDGSVYSCGWGADGQTGQGYFNNTEVFKKVGGDIANEKIIKVSSKSDFVLALNDKGDVFGWGNTEYGQMMSPEHTQQLSIPTHLKPLSCLGKIKDVGAGRCSCIVANENGDVYTWGYGLLGAGPEVQQSLKPVHIPQTLFGRNDFQPNNVVEKVKCGLNHMVAITSMGDLYSWGRNKNGCLGLGIEKDQYFPLKVSVGGLVRDAACGVDHTIIISKPFI